MSHFLFFDFVSSFCTSLAVANSPDGIDNDKNPLKSEDPLIYAKVTIYAVIFEGLIFRG